MFGPRAIPYTELTYTFPSVDRAKKCMDDQQITRLFDQVAEHSVKIQAGEEVTFKLPKERVKELKEIMKSNHSDATAAFKICQIM